MLLTSVALAALLAQPALPAEPFCAARGAAEDHGKLPWFQGSFDELLAAAKRENKPVFIDFWADWCGWCKKLTKDTFHDDTVVSELKDFFVANIDTESEAGKPVAARFRVGPLPTLMFLNPDGTVRDVILGYRNPGQFKADVQRIRKDEGTINDFKRKAEAEPASVERRLAYARKLKDVGDLAGLAAQAAELSKLDPERKHTDTGAFLFEAQMAQIEDLWRQGKMAEIPPLMAGWLAKERDPELLFKGWATLANIHDQLGQDGEQTPEEADRARHRASALTAKREAWKHVPEKFAVPFGSQVAREIWERRAQASPDEKSLAHEIARKLQPKAEEARNVDVLELVACIYHMTGRQAEALAVIQECLEIDPKNQDIQARVKEFGG